MIQIKTIGNTYSVNRLSTAIENSILQENTTSQQQSSSTPVETDIASFSTNITYKDENRQTNMSIACSELNETIVKSGETFSFCDTLGQATPEKGYEKAEVFESDGDIVNQYGGGKCQISSTLYNVVLQIPSLTVVERHEHSRSVSYVEPGKDAAVAYGSVDFKFRNDNDYDIKIYASITDETVDVKIVKLSY